MNSSSNVYIDYYQSPIGDVEIRATDTNLTHVGFVNKQCETKTNSITQRAVQQLAEYFTGQRTQFELPLGAVGTQFQTDVWRELSAIEFGQTRSYADVAIAIGRPKAVRAVGAANGRNPLGIVVPCHRVIGKNGHLTGFAHGVDKKAWLLQHEKNAPSLITPQFNNI